MDDWLHIDPNPILPFFSLDGPEGDSHLSTDWKLSYLQ